MDTSLGICAMIYLEALRELLSIVRQPSVPRDMVQSAARLTERLELCLVTVSDAAESDQGTTMPAVQLEASPAFLEFLGAARDGEWRRAVAIAKGMLATRPVRRFESDRTPRPAGSEACSEFSFN
jgi:hypothetical protein